MAKKLRILAAGDLHGDTSLAEKLAKQAKEQSADIVILTGDITLEGSNTDNLLSPFVRENKKVLLIPGNHEPVATIDFLSKVYPGVKNLHGYSIKQDDIGIFGAGSAHVGIFQVNEDEMFGLLKKSHNYIKDSKKKIMVTHIHPKGSKIEKFSNWVQGSESVARAIKEFKPDIALCSHVHEASGIEEKIGNTRVINVARRGVLIEI